MNTIDKLAEIANIHEDATPEIRKNILTVLGYGVSSNEAAEKTLEEIENKPFLEIVPDVFIIRQNVPREFHVHLPKTDENKSFDWELKEDNGKQHFGTVQIKTAKLIEEKQIEGRTYEKRLFEIPVTPELGYHELTIITADETEAVCNLIHTPKECYFPFDDKEKYWGVPLQLFSLRSEKNQGIGDFSDLSELGKTLSDNKAGILGLGPVHAMFPHNPEEASPYSPSSRTFYNHLYIDVTAVPDFEKCEEAKELYFSDGFQKQLKENRKAPYVDYTTTTKLKNRILEILYRHFVEKDFSQSTQTIEISERGKDFHKFCLENGEALDGLAVFQTLSEHFAKQENPVYVWKEWPKEYQKPDNAEVKSFAAENADRIDFFKYLQWETKRQLAEASKAYNKMPIGLYMDMAVGVSENGAETWANQELYIQNMVVGVPPFDKDPGQNWKLAALNPRSLKKQAYRPFIKMLRNNMEYAGCLRLDHVFQLRRLYIFPENKTPFEGAYIGYPAEDLMAIVALESVLNKCIVIGEDIGFDPKNFREEAKDHGFMRCRVMYDLRKDRVFCRSEEYERDAVVMSSTHDCSSLSGLWKNTYAHEGELIDLFSTPEIRSIAYESGRLDRTELNSILERTGAWKAVKAEKVKDPDCDTAEIPEKLPEAVAWYLTKSPSFAMLMSFSDMFGIDKSINFPGTAQKHTSSDKDAFFQIPENSVCYPNWRLKDPVDIENIEKHSKFKIISEIINTERASKA